MTNRMKLSVLALTAAAFAILSAPSTASARPAYNKAFYKTYDQVDSSKKCAACHGKSKKMRNGYAEALTEHLGGKNIKDEGKIIEALEATEADKEEGADKTYGEMLKAGELPPAYGE